MPQSLIKVLVHIVFSTKDRRNLIPPDLEAELYAYMSGIVRNNNAKLIIANGTPDHSHLLISAGRLDIPTLVGDLKRSTSLWMKQKGVTGFYWQAGYGAFSIGEAQVPAVRDYIDRQKEHHETRDFKDELRAICRKYDVEIDERYVWD